MSRTMIWNLVAVLPNGFVEMLCKCGLDGSHSRRRLALPGPEQCHADSERDFVVVLDIPSSLSRPLTSTSM